MGKDLFHELYDRLRDFDIRSCPPEKLSGILHGYLLVYSMVRVYPWLESDFENPYDVHERAKEIARVYEVQVIKKDLPADTRAGYAADLMDVYQLYSDLVFLDEGLDAAYDILTPWGSDKIVLPCRTPNICRLLCNCYYFAGDTGCGELAGRLVTEVLGFTREGSRGDLFSWWDAICLYDDVIGMMELPLIERERLGEERNRLQVRLEQLEDEKIERFRQGEGDEDIRFVAEVFHVLAKRAFAGYNELYRRKE